MRKLLLSLALGTGAVSSLAAQAKPWTGEFGIRSTFASVEVDDGGPKFTTIDIPGGSGFQGFGGNASLYAVFPVGSSGRFAIEPGLGFSDVTDLALVGVAATQATVNARLLYAVTSGLYVAAGPQIALLKVNGEESMRTGGQVAAGWRFNIKNLNARAEVFYSVTGEDSEIGFPSGNALGASLGLGMPVGGSRAARSARNSDRMWDLALGVQGGYTHASFPGHGEITGFSLPGNGNELSLLGVPLPGMAPWFVQIPVGERISVEPSFGYHKVDEDGGSNGSVMSLGVRGNYAFNRTFYAGLSYEMSSLSGDAFDGVDGSTGIGAAAGVRFPLVAGLTGRTELTYVVLSAGDNSFLTDGQVTSISFGVSAPIR